MIHLQVGYKKLKSSAAATAVGSAAGASVGGRATAAASAGTSAGISGDFCNNNTLVNKYIVAVFK